MDDVDAITPLGSDVVANQACVSMFGPPWYAIDRVMRFVDPEALRPYIKGEEAVGERMEVSHFRSPCGPWCQSALIAKQGIRKATFRDYHRSLRIFSKFVSVFPFFPERRKMIIDEEKRAVGRQIKRYLAANRLSREQFCFQTKLGKSTVDKLLTGLYSDKTLQIVYERTNFIRSSQVSSSDLGGYSKSMWASYINNYLFIRPKLGGNSELRAALVSIKWSDERPGLILYDISKNKEIPIGEIAIPSERSTLIYVLPISRVKAGANLILSIMVQTPIMRGLMLGVENIAAYAWIPTVVPVVLRRVTGDMPISDGDFGDINSEHPKYKSYKHEIEEVIKKQFARVIVN